ncbi:MAG: exo-alpha-sialidase, partial [Geodermatophilaceae bacterium]|nr:exo-alpha-sialidase [Geodermatophilaceae bacterium]
MSTSTDGGLTWGPALNTANNAGGIGGQPVVQPNGKVIVPTANANETSILAFRSINGGVSWSATTLVSQISDHTVAGGLRTGPLPSAEVDAAGRVYVVWQDCRFRTSCRANDIVLSTSTDGATWSTPARIPIDPVTSRLDHFIPGLAVDRNTSGASAHLALTFYFYPRRGCNVSTCSLSVGSTTSPNGGASWTTAVQIAGPMTLSQIANTSQGRMVGDYISTSFSGGTAFGVFAVGRPPSGGLAFDEGIYTTSPGVVAAASLLSSSADRPVPGAASDHAPSAVPTTRR